MLQDAVRTLTGHISARSTSRGGSLLREAPFSKDGLFQYAVRGYTDAMAPKTDWRQVRAELAQLVDDRRVAREQAAKPGEITTIDLALSNPIINQSGTILLHSEMNQVDRTIATRWASHDLDAAVDWYSRELYPQFASQDPSNMIVSVLQTVPMDRSWEVVDWINEERFTDGWSDRVVVNYTKNTAMRRDYEIAEALVAMPVEEADRLEIVAAYATPQTQGSERLLRHSPENIQRLIDAANLSEGERGRWMDIVADATWKGR